MHVSVILLIFSWLTVFPGEEPGNRETFISPLRIPLALSANFGELRYDHFHSGIDIKTQGTTGKEIVAAASGYVYRISISPGGFGKAIYLRHPSGYSTVYAHLDRFIPEIEEYVVSRQYEEKSFMVTLWPPKDKFRFDQGDIIAFSGNTGSSSGPHLHYEIRKSDEEVPVNPLKFDFGVEDRIAPVIEELVIFRAGRNTVIDNRTANLRVKVSGNSGRYQTNNGKTINISGPVGFGFKSYDLSSNSPNKSSVYSIDLLVDSSLVYSYRMDSFSFNESRFINSHIDYETYIKDKDFIERAFVLPNNRLGVYSNLENRGICNFPEQGKHRVEIIVGDIFNNRSSLVFHVNSEAPHATVNDKENNTIVMPYNRNNRFVSGDLSVNIPSGALYDTLFFEYMKTEGNPDMYSDIYHIHNRYTPLHKSYNLSIKPKRIPPGKSSKLLIVQQVNGSVRIPVQTRWENGSLSARYSSFGSFYVGIDTIPPTVSPNGLIQGVNLAGRREIRIRIADDFSGIKSYEPVIDGKWALFEYDQKNNLLTYSFDHGRITRNSKHYLTLKVTDNKDNITLYSCEFYW